jgi:ribosome maturation factor RimP
MSRNNPATERIVAAIEPACNAAGFELVDVRLLMEQGGWVLRVCIDTFAPAGEPETAISRTDISACERMSRELSAVLDVADPIPQAYSLEVSSPGIDRPLRKASHFARFAGAEAKIQLAVPVMQPNGNERRNFRGTLRGIEGATGAEVVVIEVDHETFRLPLTNIESARLAPNWDAVMRGGSGTEPKSETTPGAKPRSKKSKSSSSNPERSR